VTNTHESMSSGMVYRIRLFASLFNFSIIVLYYLSYNIVSYSLPMILYALVGLCLLGLATIGFDGRVPKLIHNLNLSLMGVLCCLCFLEITVSIFPSLAPLQIRNFLVPSDMGQIRAATVEFLDQNPYVKFKPNTVIRSQGFRGSDDQFAYEWETDKNGFKNLPEVAELNQVDIVSIGDSFTEGMGVATEDAWPAMLTEGGYTTYSLGVQGYAPSQCVGSFLKFGVTRKPNYVIIGYTAITFDREEAYIDLEESATKRKYTGGIQSIVHSEDREIRHRARYFVSAVFLLFQTIVRDYKSTAYTEFTEHTLSDRYASEIAEVSASTGVVDDINLPSRAWANALGAFADVKMLADSINSKAVLLYFPLRGQVYYKKARGAIVPDDNFMNVERAELREFCLSKDMFFLDATQKLTEYVNNLEDDAPIVDYPYLEIDGHLSKAGNRLIAQLVEEFLASQSQP
jgi:hypothetical protein